MPGAVTQSTPQRLLALNAAINETAPGINLHEYRAFLFVAEHEGACQRDVRDFLDIPQATASRVLTNLNGRGHGLLHSEPKGREHKLRVSPKGHRLLTRLAVLLGCFCVAPAANSILSQFEIGSASAMSTFASGYDACGDRHRFSCDVS